MNNKSKNKPTSPNPEVNNQTDTPNQDKPVETTDLKQEVVDAPYWNSYEEFIVNL